MAHAFHTIGHGRRPIGEFVDLLREFGVTLLADVRTMPRSRAIRNITPCRSARLTACCTRPRSRSVVTMNSSS
jgi:hypothetical protein